MNWSVPVTLIVPLAAVPGGGTLVRLSGMLRLIVKASVAGGIVVLATPILASVIKVGVVRVIGPNPVIVTVEPPTVVVAGVGVVLYVKAASASTLVKRTRAPRQAARRNEKKHFDLSFISLA